MINIIEKKDCCGCSACEQVCPKNSITMQTDVEGFLYPVVDKNTCVDCGLCEKSCPILKRFEPLHRIPKSYASRVYDDELRMHSSSGGIFTMFATNVISEGGVVFGAIFDEQWNVRHSWTDTQDGLSKFRGSKYVQSVVGDSYKKAKQFLLSGRKVLFTGTPCQIAGVKHYLQKEYENLFTIDIVCHSAPSPLVWKKYLSEISCNNLSNIQFVTFRNKNKGWREYGLKVVADNKVIEEGSNAQNAYMKGFLKDLYTRPSCTKCPARNYTSGSDIMLADSWGLNVFHPDWDDNKGMSLILVKTTKGQQYLQNICDNIFLKSVPYEEVEDRGLHAPIMLSSKPHILRKYFFKRIDSKNVSLLIEQCIRLGDVYYNLVNTTKIIIKTLFPFYFKKR